MQVANLLLSAIILMESDGDLAASVSSTIQDFTEYMSK